ncbi:MAG: hypothetical protein GX446_12200 [Chthonomonadales bacterium]|nr:hypothetical protein [Chthonomonadales bacterium]
MALVANGKAGSAQYCSGDALAIQALAMLGFAEKAVSFEALLGGKKIVVPLEPQCTEVYLRRNLAIGLEKRITGAGLLKGLLD